LWLILSRQRHWGCSHGAKTSEPNPYRVVTAGGAYDTGMCHEAIAARDAYAVIPPRKNAKP
jgi:hypothetical protein